MSVWHPCPHQELRQGPEPDGVKGRAHDMFSRIFRIRIYEVFPPTIYVIFILIFSNAQKWERKMPFLTNKDLFSFSTDKYGYILYCWKNLWIRIRKFVKICRELNERSSTGSQFDPFVTSPLITDQNGQNYGVNQDSSFHISKLPFNYLLCLTLDALTFVTFPIPVKNVIGPPIKYT